MIVTVTSLRLRRLWDFFRLSYWGMQIVKQTRTQEGFVKMKNTGFGYMHYTMSVWENESDLKTFARSGAHLGAMKQGSTIAEEVRTYTYASEKIPTWKEVKQLLKEKGKVVNY